MDISSNYPLLDSIDDPERPARPAEEALVALSEELREYLDPDRGQRPAATLSPTSARSS